MLPFRASRPQKPNLLPNLMEKGLMVLRSVANRDCQAPEMKLGRKQPSLSKSAQAVNCYYRRMSDFKQDASPEDMSFVLEMEELRKVFFRRPDCPQFCTRATSTSHYGSTTTVTLPKEVCVGSEAGKVTEGSLSSQQGSDPQADGHLPPFSKSACEFSYLRTRSESQTSSPVTSSPVLAQSHLRKRIPWYIAVIHEKDHRLSALGEEVRRLSKLAEQAQRKDEEVLALQEEREALKEQLKRVLRSRGLGMGMKERRSEPAPRPHVKLSLLQAVCRDEEEPRRRGQMQEENGTVDGGRELEAGVEEEDGLEAEAERTADEGAQGGTGGKGAVQEEGREGPEEDVELEEEAESEVQGDEDGGRSRTCSLDDSFEEELMAQLEEYEQVIQDFQTQLDVTRTRHHLATGAIISLQRQMDFQASQLQKMTMENELLQKELRERKRQLQAMTSKFSNLREDKKQQEVMGLIEEDNLVLRQQVWELQQELTKREHTLSESDAKVSELQTELTQSQRLLQRQKQLQEEAQSKTEVVRQAEQQARVALESAQSRLERLRNRIIQATFSTSGIKSLATEISDSDILEDLQRIISERTDYYHQLKQKGVKVPPLQQSELLSSPNKPKKVAASK